MENEFTKMMEAVVSLLERKQSKYIVEALGKIETPRRPSRSENISQLAEALPLAQAEFKAVAKSGDHDHYKSEYSLLDDLYKAVRPALNKHGFSLVHETILEDGCDYMLTILLHKSGEWISTKLPISLGVKLEDMGKACTYSKRYNVKNLLAIVGTNDPDDDDGEQDRKNHEDKDDAGNYKYEGERTAKLITKAQLELLEHTIGPHTQIAQSILDGFAIRKLSEIESSKFDAVLRGVVKRIEGQKKSLKERTS